MYTSEKDMLIKQKIPDAVDASGWEAIGEETYYLKEFIMKIKGFILKLKWLLK